MHFSQSLLHNQSLLHKLSRLAMAASVAAVVAACEENGSLGGRAVRPIPPETLALMEQKGTTKSAPVLIRTYKKEAEFEIWKQTAEGRYTLLKTYPMCRWSGQLGPKIQEGDRQVPEGFYAITPAQMNPNSNYYLSFNVGYPNAYDRALGRTGGSIMVHGACSSAGCFSMTDAEIAEIYAIAREAFDGGQKSIQMQSLPFRMTAENLAKHRADPNAVFWKELKDGTDHFEVTKQEPQVAVCGRRYVFDASPIDPKIPVDSSAACPPMQVDEQLQLEVAEKQKRDDNEVAELVAKGVKPVRIVYEDGGQHPDFYAKVSDVSRPEAIAAGPREIVIDESTSKSAAARLVSGKPSFAQAAEKTPPVSPIAKTAPAANVAKPEAVARSVAPDTTVEAAAPAKSEQPFYKRWFGRSEPEPLPPVDTSEPATPQPADVPLPPRRQAASPTSKPQASLPVSKTIAGTQPPLRGFMALSDVNQ